MSEKSSVETLQQIAFFEGFPENHLHKLVEISREVNYPARETLFHEHDPAKDVHVIVSGKVSLAVCAPKFGCRQIMEVNAGELFGWSPLLGRPRLSDTATTVTPTKTIDFDGSDLLDLCEKDTDFGYHFMRRMTMVLSDRLSATRRQLFDLGGRHLPEVFANTD